MSSVESEKWLLVEWGNGARGVVNSRYMVNKSKQDLKTGCTITISKRGEQQLATYIARSNDRQLLEQIAGDEAGPSVPQEPEPGDFSPSASDWEPSGDDGSDSEVEAKKTKFEVVHKRTSRNTRNKKVIKPSNKVKAIIPNNMRKNHQINMKTYVNRRKRSHENSMSISENNNTQPTNKHIQPPNNVTAQSRIVTLTLDANLIVNLFETINKMAQKLAMLNGETLPNKKTDEHRSNESRNNLIVTEETDEERNHSDESNRSDDNVLISNKYVNIQNNVQENEYLTVVREPSIAKCTQQADTFATQEENNRKRTVTPVTENIQNQSIVYEIVDENTIENTSAQESHNKQAHKILSDTQIQKKNIANNTNHQITSNSTQQKKVAENIQNENEWVPIGSGKTLIHKDKFKKIKWSSYTVATRTLLLALFPRRTLATHSLTGKKSPAFQNKPAKMCLDPKKIADIIIEVMDRFDVKENLVRGIITTKCADESKMFKTRMEKKKNSALKQ